MGEQEYVVQMKGITKVYPNGVAANQGVDFNVKRGDPAQPPAFLFSFPFCVLKKTFPVRKTPQKAFHRAQLSLL